VGQQEKKGTGLNDSNIKDTYFYLPDFLMMDSEMKLLNEISLFR